ncbi:MAG: putative cytochrome c1 signal peptide protein [Rhodanobacteraceae bacterium]|nr:MAG: putative cytochrome c1 signal peptide protein [Rhodanobacteraceae bacterium]
MSVPESSLNRLGGLACLLWLVISPAARAVPAFARQTGQACMACHVSFPELTPYGRMFKLSGYTIGSRLTHLPVALMVQVGDTGVRNNRDDQGNQVVPKTDSVQLSAASLFLAGKISDNAGGWIQWTYNNLNVNDAGQTVGHSGIDNTDLRLVGRVVDADNTTVRWLYGLTLNNNPTVQDAWNSTPAFGFPFTLPPNMISPAAATMFDGSLAQQVAGIGGYVFWNRSLYFELSGYRTADGVLSWLRAGQDIHTPGGVHRLAGTNPYWRFAWNHEWGPHSLMLGTYGMRVRVYPDNTMPFTPTDRFTDIAIDAQYQYITDPHTVTLEATRIHERQDYAASFPATMAGSPIGAGPAPANLRDTLNTTKLKVTYYFQRKYGATLAWFSTTGSADPGLYPPGSVGGSLNGRPDTRGFIPEIDYLPIPNLRLMLQYYDYRKFNGGTTNYDGAGRSARDNNTWFLNLWFAY